ncbi:MAG TPA: 50S ribosomal protein L29 [Saprospiraceae bacterium]|nr:50S ribosomal protein L29 [Saprospiraceae bacterium]
MASEKYKQLQEMSDTDLQTELAGTMTQYQRLKFDHVIKGLENPIGLRDVRRDIARLRTELRKRELNGLPVQSIAERSRLRARRRAK